MTILVAYDVGTADKAGTRRLRRVARACEDFGIRVQKSLFECRLGMIDWVRLRDRLLNEMDPKQDSVRFYFLDTDVKVEHHGVDEPLDPEGPLVV